MIEQIFISYSKKDSEFAHKLADNFAEAGFKIWIDRLVGGFVAIIFSNRA